MHNAIAHHPMSSQTLSSSPEPALPPASRTEHNALWCGISPWPAGASCPSFFCPPVHLLVRWGEEQKRPWLSVSTTQLQLKHQSVTNFILILNSKHSTLLATSKKNNFIPAQAWQLCITTTYLSSSGVVWVSIIHNGFAHWAHRHFSLRLRNFN